LDTLIQFVDEVTSHCRILKTQSFARVGEKQYDADCKFASRVDFGALALECIHSEIPIHFPKETSQRCQIYGRKQVGALFNPSQVLRERGAVQLPDDLNMDQLDEF